MQLITRKTPKILLRTHILQHIATHLYIDIIYRDMSLEKSLRCGIIGGILILPFIVLIVASNMFFPYIVGKNFTFRIVIEVIFSAWLVLIFLNSKYRPRLTPLLIAFIALVGVVALADLFGANPYRSFWGNYERMGGFITLLHVFVFFVIAQSVMIKEELWLWFWRISIGVSAFISIHTLIQSFSSSARMYSTLGNPIYLAVYALFHIFVVIILLVRHEASLFERSLYIMILPFLFIAVYLTASRGATLGIVAGLLIASLGIAYSYRNAQIITRTASVIALTLILIVSGFYLARDTKFVKTNSSLSRFSSISLSDPSIFSRTVIWGIAWNGFMERPILGWGQENFDFIFNAKYNPEMYNMEQWYDRAHSVVFDWLADAGILGLGSYVTLLFFVFWVLFKTKRIPVLQKWLFVGLLSAYILQNLTVFDEVISYLLFFSIVAWITTKASDVWSGSTHQGIYEDMVQQSQEISSGSSQNENEKIKAPWQVWSVSGLAFSVGLFLIFSLNVQQIRANKLLLSGFQDSATAQVFANRGYKERAQIMSTNALEKLQTAAALRTFGTQEIHEQIAMTADVILNSSWSTPQLATAWYDAAVNGMLLEEKKSPLDARSTSFLAEVYRRGGQFDKEYTELLKANKLSPKKQTFIIQLANNALARKDKKQALEYAKKAYYLEKNNIFAETFYALTLIQNGAIQQFQSLFGTSTTLGARPLMLATLVKIKQDDIAKQLWKQAFAKTKDSKTAFLLTAIYQQIGEQAKAIDSAKQVAIIAPLYASRVKQAIEQLNQADAKTK